MASHATIKKVGNESRNISWECCRNEDDLESRNISRRSCRNEVGNVTAMNGMECRIISWQSCRVEVGNHAAMNGLECRNKKSA